MTNKQKDYLNLIKFYQKEVIDICFNIFDCVGNLKIQDTEFNPDKVIRVLEKAFAQARRGYNLMDNQDIEIAKLIDTLSIANC